MTYWNLSSSFMGFTEVQAANQTVTLSASAETVVDVQIEPPDTPTRPSGALSPSALAISGGFRVCDPTTGAVV